jgi:hypothetical protein
MIDYEDDFTSDYKGRDRRLALEEAQQMVNTILTPPDQTPPARVEYPKPSCSDFPYY